MFAGLESGQIKVIDLRTGGVQKTLMGHEGGVMSIMPSSNFLFTAGNDGKIKVWDVRKGNCVDQVLGHKAKYNEAALTLCRLSYLNMIASGTL